MVKTFPGTTIEISKLEKGSSLLLFDGIFATGGITLSQISVMTGLEPYLIQNWVKRGFLSSPVKRVYSREQFSRIVIINMLRESLQLEKICGLIHLIGGKPDNKEDDLIGFEELYHRYVDMIADQDINITDEASVMKAIEKATDQFECSPFDAKKQLIRVLQVMIYAHASARLRASAEQAFSAME